MLRYSVMLERYTSDKVFPNASRVIAFDVDAETSARSVLDILEASNDFTVLDLFAHNFWNNYSEGELEIVNPAKEQVQERIIVPTFKTREGFRNFLARRIIPYN